MKKFAVLIIGSFLFSLLLCYIDDETKGLSALFTPGMMTISAVYAIVFTFIPALIDALKVKPKPAYGILAIISVAMSWGFVNKGHNYLLGVIVYSVLFFVIFSAIFYLGLRIGRMASAGKRNNAPLH